MPQPPRRVVVAEEATGDSTGGIFVRIKVSCREMYGLNSAVVAAAVVAVVVAAAAAAAAVADIAMAYIVTAYTLMAHIVMAYIATAM